MGIEDLGIGDALGAVQPPVPVVQPQVQAPQPQVAPAVQPPAAKPLFSYGQRQQAPGGSFQDKLRSQEEFYRGMGAKDPANPFKDAPLGKSGGDFGPGYGLAPPGAGNWEYTAIDGSKHSVFDGSVDGGFGDKTGIPTDATAPVARNAPPGQPAGARLADAGNRTKTGTEGMTEIKGKMSPAQTAAMATDPQRAAVAKAIDQPLPPVVHAPHLPSYDEWKQQHNQGAIEGLRPLLTVGIAGALIVGAALGRKHGGGTQMALSGLAGFVNGMAAGSHSQASKGLAEYHAAVQNLKDNYSMQRSEYTDILNNRNLNIDAKVSALKLKAAEYGDQKLAAAIEGGNIAAIDQVMKVRQQAMQHADDLHQAAVDRHKKFEYDHSPQDEKAEASAEKESATAEKEYDKSMSALGKAEKAYKANPADDSAREAFALAMQRAQMAREKQKEVLGRLSGKGPVSVGPEQGPKQDQRSFLQKNLPGFLGGQKDPNVVEGQVEPGAQQQEAAPAAAPKMPTPGDTIDGYMFKGGDPASPDSWARHGA